MRKRNPFYKARAQPGAGPHDNSPRGGERRQARAAIDAEVDEALEDRQRRTGTNPEGGRSCN